MCNAKPEAKPETPRGKDDAKFVYTGIQIVFLFAGVYSASEFE